jgi:hypothetical protein
MRTVMVGHPLNTSSVVWSVLLCGSTWVAQRCVAQSQSTAQGTDDKISDSAAALILRPEKGVFLNRVQ